MSGTEIDNLELSPEELQARLGERDELVAELTARLEQAAEQLDRLKRMGADRGLRISGGSLPPEFLEQQRQLSEELQQVLESWGDFQPGLMFSRIEMQLEEIRDLIVQTSSNGGGTPSPATSATSSSAYPTETAAPQSAEPAGAHDEEDADATPLSTYEAFKAGLSVEESSASSPSSEQSLPGSGEAGIETAEIPRVDPPEEIDAEETDPDRLWKAIDQRDSYIVYLSQRLRAAEMAQRPLDRWSDLEHAPEELTESLQNYEKQLEDLLRMAEVETSLERARLGREAARLEQQKQLLEREKSRLGIESAEKADTPQEGPDDLPKARTWWALFRRNEENANEQNHQD